LGHPSIGTVEQLLTVMKKHDKRSLGVDEWKNLSI